MHEENHSLPPFPLKYITFDQAWKAAIEDFFEAYVRYFFESWADEVDFERGFESMDKEMALLFPDSDVGLRVADKVMKAWLKSGDEVAFLHHVEVQGQKTADIAERMFVTRYRLFDMRRMPVAAHLILTDEVKDFKPSAFRSTFWNTELSYHFPIFKLLEHHPKTLWKEGNLFSFIMVSAWYGLKKKKPDDDELLSIARELVRQLLHSGLEKAVIRQVLEHLKSFIRFDNSEIRLKFEGEITIKSKAMGIIEVVRQAYLLDAEDRGISKGEQIGMSKGEQIGMSKGEQIGMSKGESKAKYSFVENMLLAGYQMEEIVKIAGVTREFVEQVRKEMKK